MNYKYKANIERKPSEWNNGKYAYSIVWQHLEEGGIDDIKLSYTIYAQRAKKI